MCRDMGPAIKRLLPRRSCARALLMYAGRALKQFKQTEAFRCSTPNVSRDFPRAIPAIYAGMSRTTSVNLPELIS